MATADLTAARLRELLNYDSETGRLTWRVKVAQPVKVGDNAGCRHTDGYTIVRVSGKRYLAHRLAWLYVYGVWPSMCIDHINGIKSDNRLCNLRDVEVKTNNQNVNAARKDSVSGVQGVRRVGNRFEARMRVNGQKKCLGFFASEEEARAEYMRAKRQHHPGFAA
jgi:hypothetical protein